MAGNSHPHPEAPSAWVARWAELIAERGRVLDVAAGSGRHARHFAARGCAVDAVDRDASALAAFAGLAGIETLCADIEAGPWPYAGRQFDGIVVCNYLHRPLFPHLLSALAPGGVLIYETFAAGNERYGRPRNPDFLLCRGELLELVRGKLRVVGYEDAYTAQPRPAVMQRLCAVGPGSVKLL
jgi:SAM-dependent methyltransferase